MQLTSSYQNYGVDYSKRLFTYLITHSKAAKARLIERLKATKVFLIKYMEDILIVSGLIFIIKATFLLSTIAGLYCLGVCLLALGIYFTVFPARKG